MPVRCDDGSAPPMPSFDSELGGVHLVPLLENKDDAMSVEFEDNADGDYIVHADHVELVNVDDKVRVTLSKRHSLFGGGYQC